MSGNPMHRGFTLVELLIVIGIVAALAVVVVTTLNPTELLRQAQDSTRIGDITAVSRALAIYQVEFSSATLGSPNTVYVSLPDGSPTCASLGLPGLPSGWTYSCKTSSDYRNTDGTGWIPVDFASLSSGSPFDSLPVDSLNEPEAGRYYTYSTSDDNYVVSTRLQSEKYILTAATDGGLNPVVLEKGTDLTIAPFIGEMVGYWDFNDSFADRSGYGKNGFAIGGTTFTDGQFGRAGSFDGIDDYVSVTMPNQPNPDEVTFSFWNRPDGPSGGKPIVTYTGHLVYSTRINLNAFSNVSNETHVHNRTNNGIWEHVAITMSFLTNEKKFYINGAQVQQNAIAVTKNAGNFTSMRLGGWNGGTVFDGEIDELRIFNRYLSEAEIAALYASR